VQSRQAPFDDDLATNRARRAARTERPRAAVPDDTRGEHPVKERALRQADNASAAWLDVSMSVTACVAWRVAAVVTMIARATRLERRHIHDVRVQANSPKSVLTLPRFLPRVFLPLRYCRNVVTSWEA